MTLRDDVRRLIGRDERRVSWTDTDRARGETLVTRYGGVLEVRAASAQLVLTWTSPTGGSISVEGRDGAQCVTLLAQSLRSLPPSLPLS